MKIKKLILVCLALLLSYGAYCQKTTRSPEQIRKEMAEIRRNTDWSNEAAANKAQAKIEALSKELMIAGKAQQQQAAGMQVDSAKLNEEAEYKMKLWSQMMKIVDQGEEGKWDLAKPLREEIVEEYKKDEDPTIKNNEWFETMPTLVLNLSWPQIKLIIDQMTLFRGIRTLIVTCDKKSTAVDLEIILKNAAGYPLEELYIINFGITVSSLPSGIGNFSGLKKLSLLNNNIQKLPPTVANLSQLEILHIDLNPVETLISQVGSLKELKQLGVGKTKIPETELSQIKKLLPACQILR